MSIHEQAVATTLAFIRVGAVRNHSRERRREERQRAIRLRDSLLYRSDAMIWHASLLKVLQSAALRRLYAQSTPPADQRDLLLQAAAEQHYVFDDLVFNAVALFDYAANLIGFAYYGDRRRKAKWDKVQRIASDAVFDAKEHGSARLASSATGTRVRELHKRLVFPLSEHRADLIHYQALTGKGAVENRLSRGDGPGMELSIDLTVRVAWEFMKRLSVPATGDGTEALSLIEAADWLVAEVSGAVLALLRELERDLRYEAGLDPDGHGEPIEIV